MVFQSCRDVYRGQGVGKELFTTADNYAIIIADSVKENDPVRVLIFGAVMSIDMVLKEH